MLRNLWIVLRNIPSVLLFRFSLAFAFQQTSTKCEERAFVIECIELELYNLNPYALFGMFQPELSRENMNIIKQ